MNQPPEPVAAAYHAHLYNWSIELHAQCLSLDLGWHPSVCLHGSLTKVARSLSQSRLC